MTAIDTVTAEPVDLLLDSPFEISLGEHTVAENVLVTVETESGVRGYGEASPNQAVTGETQETVLAAVDSVGGLLAGRPVADYRALVSELRRSVGGAPTGLAAVETALVDCYCRTREIPLAELFGGSPSPVRTGLTVPLVSPTVAGERAAVAADRGFETLKIKAGGPVAEDVARVSAVRDAAPGVSLLVDPNQGWTPARTQRFITKLDQAGIEIALLEQPVSKTDLRGLATVRSEVSVPVAADEAVFTAVDALEAVRQDAVDVINLKVAKSGLLGALDIAAVARAANVELMIGCMLESAVGTHASAHLAAGLGTFEYVDLDSTALLADNVAEPGPGPVHSPEGPGHGIIPM